MANSLYLARMDIAHDQEDLFNEVYNSEHIPAFSNVPGVKRIKRYATQNRAEPKYLAVYELENSDVLNSEAWLTAREAGRWPSAVRPHTMNRQHAVLEWVGGTEELLLTTKYFHLAMMDIEPHKEQLFNDTYETEHIPLLLEIPGVESCVRYKTSSESYPSYVSVYEITDAALPVSKEWWVAADTGRWKPDVRPYTYNKRLPVYELLGT
ncbi:MAG: hypothetical protein CL896_06720 [Dehalococcoidia bacterium]|nr:hypothetical protein [Dehalococcoidia bacterium]|tara:strand:- start:155 stop:781 length:627 start_codon:yes stop_codon:yes gene_type:complete